MELPRDFGLSRLDLSPISLRPLWGSFSLLGICHVAVHYNVNSFNVLCRLAGAGYQVRSRLCSTSLTKKWECLRVISSLPGRSAFISS